MTGDVALPILLKIVVVAYRSIVWNIHSSATHTLNSPIVLKTKLSTGLFARNEKKDNREQENAQ